MELPAFARTTMAQSRQGYPNPGETTGADPKELGSYAAP